MESTVYQHTHWYDQETGADTASSVATICNALWKESAQRRARCQLSLSLYEGRRLPGLYPLAYTNAPSSQGETFDPLTWNIPRSLCQTAQAKIAARQQPKAQFVVTDGDWEIKRKAKKLDRFVEAQMHHTQGCYEDSWELGQQIFLDACVFGIGVCKVFADIDSTQVSQERIFPWEILVDPNEARYGNPANIFHRYGYDVDKLLARFAGDPAKLNAIKSAKVYDDESTSASASTRVVKQIAVYEAWRLPVNTENPGRHVLCIDGMLLDEEDWDEPDFPFVFLRWSSEMIGFGAKSLMEEVAGISDEMNHTLQRMQEAERKCSNGMFIYEEGSVDDEDLNSNDIGVKIPVKKGSMMVPNYVAPQSYSSSTMQWLQLQKSEMFEICGISEMSATSRKESGVTAGVAIRTLADLETERFAVIYREYEQFYTSLARRMVAETRKLAEEDPSFASLWPGGEYLKEIKWEDCKLDVNQYHIRIYPVSGIKNTPADRLQLANELFGSGQMSQEAYQAVLSSLDMPGELDKLDRWRRWVEKNVERWLDAKAGDDTQFEPPIKFMPLDAALLQVAESYADALLEGAPDYNREFFTRFMEMCDRMIQERAQRLAALQQPQPPAAGPAPPQLQPEAA